MSNSNTIPFSEFRRLLTELGFVETRVKGSHVAFRHEPTDTIFLSPPGTKRVTVQRVASARRIVTGRGVTTGRHFDSLVDTICGQKV